MDAAYCVHRGCSLRAKMADPFAGPPCHSFRGIKVVEQFQQADIVVGHAFDGQDSPTLGRGAQT